jgi:hypothetical protein
MAATITANGPQIDTLAQVISDLLNGTTSASGFYQIYGPTINVASNSPDGQIINIFALSKIDMENFGVAIYDSFDPDQAIGVSLDNVAQYCGINRQTGSYTQVVIQVVTNTTLNLNGLDLVYGSTPYTIQDGNGNQYNLITSASLINGTNNLNFQAVSIGVVQAAANTITTPVTIVSGVVSVNNSSVPYQVGTNEETDANFRLRRQASTSYPAQGALNGLYAGLLNLSGMVSANVYENTTSGIVNGIPANGIWVVVNGSTPAAIANVIYNRRNLGVPMKGSQTYVVTQANGSTITMQWDNAVSQNLYIYGYVHSLTGASVNVTAIIAYIVANWGFKIYQTADISSLDVIINAAQSGIVASGLGLSLTGAYFYSNVTPSSQQNYFTLTSGNISLTVI